MSDEVILMHLAEIKLTLSDIKTQTMKTNGRVTSLEMWQATVRGMATGSKIVLSLIAGGSGLVGALIGALLK